MFLANNEDEELYSEEVLMIAGVIIVVSICLSTFVYLIFNWFYKTPSSHERTFSKTSTHVQMITPSNLHVFFYLCACSHD